MKDAANAVVPGLIRRVSSPRSSRAWHILFEPAAAAFQILSLIKPSSEQVLATKRINFEPPGSATSVHPKETTDAHPQKNSYRQSLLVDLQAEYDATEKAYIEWDTLDEKERTEQLQSCRTNAWFAIHLPTRTVRILSSACRLRWCPLCAKSRTKTILRNLEPWVRLCRRGKFLTLTLKHTTDTLQAQIVRLYACFSTFRKRRFVKTSVSGGVWFFQLKFNHKTQEWHPHLHCLLDAEYMHQKVLSQIWLEITGDSDIVDIRAVRDSVKASNEVARYSARPAQLDKLSVYEALEMMQALHKRRLCGTWGSAKEIRLTPDPAAGKDEYFSVCSYTDLKSLAKDSVFAESLRQAYMTNEPLDILCTRENIQDLYEQMQRDTEWDIPPPKTETANPTLFDMGPAPGCVS